MYRREKQLLLDNGYDLVSYEKHNDHIPAASSLDQIRAAYTCIWSGKAYQEVKQIINKERPNVVHFHNTFPQMSLSVYKACKDAGVPIVQTLHNFRHLCANGLFMRQGSHCEDCLQGDRICVVPALRNRCYRDSVAATLPLALQIKANHRFKHHGLVDRYICLTEFSKTKFASAGYAPDTLTVKPNFVDDPGMPKELREGFLFVGRLTDEKGPMLLLEAWKQVPDIPLTIVGDGALRSELEHFALTNRLNVHFTGLLPNQDVLALQRKAVALIVPSKCYEGFPAAVVEAYASGTPVIASNLGSLAELVDDQRTGLLFTAYSHKALARSVAYANSHPREMSHMGIQARASYLKRYTREANVEQLNAIYEQAITDASTRQQTNGIQYGS